MPEFITFDDLKRFAPPLTEARAMRKSASTRRGKTVFLSHSSKDNEHLPAMIKILENHGGHVYVDNGDDRLPEKPSPKTAQLLRDALNGCPRLVLFVTTHSKGSRWMPWELGLGDAYHSPDSVALFPAALSGGTKLWAEREYLGLYRRIVWGSINGSKKKWIVWNHVTNSATPLRRWLTH